MTGELEVQNCQTQQPCYHKKLHKCITKLRPASVALSVALRYAQPGYGDRRVWLEAQAGQITVSGYSGVCFEIKFSGRHRGFDGVLFNP